MWFVAVRASRYTIMRRWWSCASPGGWSSQRTISHNTSAIESRDNVYTFSFTTDWFHTVNAVAETVAPASAARRRGHRAGTQARIQRSPTRNQHAAAIALVVAASRLIRIAYPAARGNKPQVWAISVNSGLPGGCGMPST